jgi:hypothetical protein
MGWSWKNGDTQLFRHRSSEKLSVPVFPLSYLRKKLSVPVFGAGAYN